MQIPARRIADFARSRLPDSPCPVTLLACFDNHVYLHWLDRDAPRVLVSCRKDGPMGPLDLVLGCWPDWQSLQQASGLISREKITLPDLVIRLEPACPHPSSAPPPIAPECLASPPFRADLLATLARIAEVTAPLEHNSGFLTAILADPCRPDLPECDLAALRSGLLQADMTLLSEGASELAGLGQGLTPSGDDFLCGIMAALRSLSDTARTVSDALLDGAKGRTTTLSFAFLEAAAQGHVTVPWKALLIALPDEPSPDALADLVAAVTQPGHSSGADMLAGFLWACHALLS